MRIITGLCAATLALCLIAYSTGATSGEQINRMKERADLDGDGSEETVYFASFSISGHYSNNTFVLKVCGRTAAFEGDNLNGYFKIVDIDTSDRYLEIAVPEEGQSDDHQVHYFRYSSGEIIKLGTLPGSTREWNTKIDGSGIVQALVRGNILDTWDYWGKFKYDDCSHDFVEIFKRDFVLNREVTVKEELPLYKDKDMTQIAFTAKVGEKGVITKTDNRLWCLFESDSGEKGWFPVWGSNILHINKLGYQVFDGLQLAD